MKEEPNFLFNKKKYIILICSIFLLILGFVLMSGGGASGSEFNPEISIEQSCSYFNPDNPVALVKVIVNNSKSEVGARVLVPLGELEEGVTAPVEVFTVAPGASGNTEITREYGEVFEVRVFAAENQGLYETVVEPVTIDCPRFDVEVELGEIDCNIKPPKVTVIFKNNSGCFF